MEQKTEASQAVDEQVLPHLPRAVGYRHTMDNTEGIKGNKPVVIFCATKPNPFGIPGLDYSSSFPVTTETLFTADQMRAYARAALKAQPAEIDPALLRALKEACDLAMKNTVAARVPECGDFGAIAQNLDYALSQLKAQPAPTEAAQGEQLSGNSGELAQGEGSARLDADGIATIEEAVKVLESGAKHNFSHGRTVFSHVQADRAGRLRAALDRARASAETGGVKP